MEKQAEAAALKKSRSEKKLSIISDEEQLQIDALSNATLTMGIAPVVVLAPGSLEFDKAASKTTPIELVKGKKTVKRPYNHYNSNGSRSTCQPKTR